MKVELEIEAGDQFWMNDKWWTVEGEGTGLNAGMIDAKSPMNKLRTFERDELEELIRYSGQFRLIRRDYLDVFDQ